jgi:uncharacterized membrane protein YbaN (DUF454 family)
MKKIILIICGTLSLMLGGIGVIFPILPTTPFVLLAAGCFSAYPAVYKRISKIRFFREYLESYKSGAPISPKVRAASITVLWLTLIASMIVAQNIIMFTILPIVGVAVTIHLLTIGRGKSRISAEFNENPGIEKCQTD